MTTDLKTKVADLLCGAEECWIDDRELANAFPVFYFIPRKDFRGMKVAGTYGAAGNTGYAETSFDARVCEIAPAAYLAMAVNDDQCGMIVDAEMFDDPRQAYLRADSLAEREAEKVSESIAAEENGMLCKARLKESWNQVRAAVADLRIADSRDPQMPDEIHSSQEFLEEILAEHRETWEMYHDLRPDEDSEIYWQFEEGFAIG